MHSFEEKRVHVETFPSCSVIKYILLRECLLVKTLSCEENYLARYVSIPGQRWLLAGFIN